ncbi:MAG: LysR family transcriptional regulator [Paracoccaceae bacterium]
MFLKQLEYLIAVIEEDHFGRAATRCNVKQPSLSNGIKQLELELGVTLFKRGRGQRLYGVTEEGKRVSEWARIILANCTSMRNTISEMQNNLSGTIRLGAITSMSPVLPIILQRIRRAYPLVSVDVRFVGNEELRTGLDNFSIDCGITYMDQAVEMPWCESLPIFEETWSLLVPDSFEFEAMEQITWEQAGDLPLALLRPTMYERAIAEETFLGAGKKVIPKIESESILHLMFQTQFTELCTVIPSHYTRMPGLHPGTKALLLKDPIIKKGIGLFWLKTETEIPITKIAEEVGRSLAENGELQNFLYRDTNKK